MAIEIGIIAFSAALTLGITAIGAAIAEKEIGTAAVGAVAEKPEIFGKVLLLTVLPETLVIFGLIIAIMIIGMAA